MKAGVIGLGNIAHKAYLPVLTTRTDLELVLATRNPTKLALLQSQYRINTGVYTIDDLINSRIDVAFVHTASSVHAEMVEKLLKNGIHVFVDKPLSYSYESSQKLVQLASEMNRILMVGFNRRFTPQYTKLKKVENPEIILMQKNRVRLPGTIRSFIFDDFIHVVDTLRFLLTGPIEQIHFTYHMEKNELYRITLELSTRTTTAIGIMNRNSGKTEEIIEVQSPGEKMIIRDLSETTLLANETETKLDSDPWESTLHKRGFPQMIDQFIHAVKNGTTPSPSPADSLKTHEICDFIAQKIEGDLFR